MKKTIFDVTFRMTMFAESSDYTVFEVLKDMEYDFRSRTEGATIEEAKIVAVDIDDEDL
jgi:hypothetical protein